MRRAPPLKGLEVVLTRPVGSAAALLRDLRADGAACANLPLFSVQALAPTPALAASLAMAERADALVFASPNAVRACWRLQPRFRARGVVFAQGPATARALRRRGVAPVVPERGFASEDLLAHAFFAEVAGRHVVRLAGRGGRDLLPRTLAARGARVDVLALYERVPAKWDRRHRDVLDRFADAWFVITSAEGLQQFAERVAAAPRRRLLVSSERLHAAAQAAGFARVRVAASAAAADLRAALGECNDAPAGR
jgi:uroporphyrinogen-III synthase